MALYIRLEDKKDIEWMQRTLDRWMDQIRQKGVPADLSIVDHIANWSDAIAQAKPTTKAEALEVPGEALVEDKPKTKTKTKDTWVPNLCADHPKRQMKRTPSDDCEGCWKAYKRLHPLEYTKQRQKFERKIRASN